MKIRLCARQAELEYAWRAAFVGVPEVEVLAGDILGYVADAIVSPANSFGYMDGGIDLVYSLHFGWHVEDRVRRRILEDYDGELPVGDALIVPTDDARVPWLVSAPTMRVPMRVDHTVNAYLAFRATLLAIRRHNRTSSTPIASVLVPGLGTGEGRMPAKACARQMRAAIDAVMVEGPLRKGGLAAAVRHHLRLMGERE